MFWTRLVSGIVLVAAALLTINAGGAVLCATLLAVSVIGMSELYHVTNVEDRRYSPMAITAYAGAAVYYILMFAGLDPYLELAAVGILIALMCVYVFTFPRYLSGQTMAAFFGVVYVAVMLSCIFRTRMLSHGQITVWLIFLSSWGCDTCAYCVGMLLGKHKMAPVLSPKKSVEGAVGGVVGAALLGAIYAGVTGRFTGRYPVAQYMIICAAGALISMVGDLAASAIKRNHDVKDYGKLIPGHGGILDRFDSVIFTSPVIFFLAKILL